MSSKILLTSALFILTSYALPPLNYTSLRTLPISEQDSNCSLAASYQSWNASSSYSIQGVDVSNHIVSSRDPFHIKNWTLSTTVAHEQGDKYPIIRQSFWLDTSSTLSVNSTGIPWNGVASIYLGLPESISGKGRDDDGTCSTLLGRECASALQDQFRFAALKVANSTERRQVGSAERELTSTDLASRVPAACKDKTGREASEGWGSVISGGVAFPPRKASNCSFPVPPTVPDRLRDWATVVDISPSNFSVYDQYISRVTPVLITMWSNNTIDQQIQPWADTRLVCVRPSSIAKGSRDPVVESSTPVRVPSGTGKVFVSRSAWVGLALGLVAACMVGLM